MIRVSVPENAHSDLLGLWLGLEILLMLLVCGPHLSSKKQEDYCWPQAGRH